MFFINDRCHSQILGEDLSACLASSMPPNLPEAAFRPLAMRSYRQIALTYTLTLAIILRHYQSSFEFDSCTRTAGFWSFSAQKYRQRPQHPFLIDRRDLGEVAVVSTPTYHYSYLEPVERPLRQGELKYEERPASPDFLK